jgi:hypothetical protein
MSYLIAAAVLATVVIVLSVLAYLNRGDPAWQRDMPRLRLLLLGQVAIIALLLIFRVFDPN